MSRYVTTNRVFGCFLPIGSVRYLNDRARRRVNRHGHVNLAGARSGRPFPDRYYVRRAPVAIGFSHRVDKRRRLSGSKMAATRSAGPTLFKPTPGEPSSGPYHGRGDKNNGGVLRRRIPSQQSRTDRYSLYVHTYHTGLGRGERDEGSDGKKSRTRPGPCYVQS